MDFNFNNNNPYNLSYLLNVIIKFHNQKIN